MMTDLLLKTRNALIQAGINPRKKLSQNFLINEEILDKQLTVAEVGKKDIILEIGGGTGILTERLGKKAARVFCIEYDEKLANYLKRTYKTKKHITIIHADVLKAEFPPFTKVVANLPYHISSPVTFRLLDVGFDLAVLMYQYEFAKRMIAEPGTDDYSRLSVNLQYQADVEIAFRVSRNNFYPMPKVDSAIVKITPKDEELPVPPSHFRWVTRVLFNTKNKLVGSIFYDYFKKIIPKKMRVEFRKEINTTITHYKTRVRELTTAELAEISTQLEEALENLDLLSTVEVFSEDESYD